MKDVRITIYTTENERKAWKATAEGLHSDLHNWIRTTLHAAAAQYLAKEKPSLDKAARDAAKEKADKEKAAAKAEREEQANVRRLSKDWGISEERVRKTLAAGPMTEEQRNAPPPTQVITVIPVITEDEFDENDDPDERGCS